MYNPHRRDGMKPKMISKIQERRLKEATENFKEIEKILAPFVQPRKIVNITTEGQWQRASNENAVFTPDLYEESFEKVSRFN
jgi:hypothetical protein